MPRPTRRVPVIAAATLALASVLATGPQIPASAATTVTVNGATTFQKIEGFGISEAFGMANAIRGLGATARQQALDLLFSTTNGAGFSILRNGIPSGSDSIEPRSPGSPSATPTYVWNPNSDATDQGQLWLAKQAKNTYGVTNFYDNAWAPPGYMKTDGSDSGRGPLCGVPGATCASGDWRQHYANYLVQHAKFWASAGLTPSATGFVNEPSQGSGFGSMQFTPAQAVNFLSVLGPAMKASGLPTKIACCDLLGFNQLPSYVSAVTGNAAANAATGLFTAHGYSGAPTSPVSTGGRSVWQSEWSVNGNTWDGSWDGGGPADGFHWAQQVHTALAGANVNAFLYFWGISTTSHDSSLIGLRGSTLTPAKRYYALANYSRFIRPGATRISATGSGSLAASAYRNPDGSVVVVLLNSGTGSVATTVATTGTGLTSGTVTPYLTNSGSSTAAQPTIGLANGAFSATVPARSLVTYRITR
ncbi:glycoside hydrolase family 30 beta sandwich domain-containing protein [Amycolatopsis sp. NEAU-NG30]|uniref:Glycoside hydrolase family 30 beta sandwich domain-containing protein n=1 Tax=Amycolatopsis melonis TaxID=3156488 RepID=A0ABV0LUM8_9PSEU